MSLYRTWRPPSFADLVGQEAVVTTLTASLRSNRIAHAYLFAGPKGSGKTSAAKILARCINCGIGPTATPDNTCEACRAILNGNAIDVLELDAASNGGIETVRQLRETVQIPPTSMRQKVYIIDEAHMLTPAGANALLKTLEEPPPNVVFILATTDANALPATIVSRCQNFTFRRIPVTTMVRRLRQVADAENISIDEEALTAIARRADGALRDALTMLEQVSTGDRGHVDLATVTSTFRQTKRSLTIRLRDATISNDAIATLTIIENAASAGDDMIDLLRSLVTEFRNLLVARVHPNLLERDLSSEDIDNLVETSQIVSQATTIQALRILADAFGSTRTNENPRLTLESALLRLIITPRNPALPAISARISQLEQIQTQER